MHNHILRFLIVAALSVPSVVSADQAKAKRDYERFCAGCHGFNGMSVAPDAPNLRMNQGLLQFDLQLVQKLKMGSPKKPPMMGLLSDQDLQQVIIYSRSLR